MAPTINQEIGLRLDTDHQSGTDREVSLPSAQPSSLESPFSSTLPRTAAGHQRAAASSRTRRTVRFDWFQLSTVGLGLACTALSVYRLFWAIH